MKKTTTWMLLVCILLICQGILNNSDAQVSDLKDITVKTFRDANFQILDNKDSLKASYYRIITYRGGKVYGAIKDFYRSGRPLMIGYYNGDSASPGYENGKFIRYHENGNIFQTSSYVNGLLDGIYIEYYPSGQKKACVSYTMGKRVGCEYSWDENGRASVYNQNYENCPCSKIENTSQFAPSDNTNPTMTLRDSAVYQEGNKTNELSSEQIRMLQLRKILESRNRYPDSMGVVIEVKTFYDSTFHILENKDSLDASYYRIIKYRAGKVYQAVVDYYKSGMPYMVGYYGGNNISKGYENGTFTRYFENGRIFQTCKYVNGLLNGLYIEYYPSGLKKACVSYLMGKRYGCEYSWDENGKASVYNQNNQLCPCARAENENLKLNLISSTNSNQAVYSPPKVNFVGHFNNDLPIGDYQLFDNNVYYKSQGLEITSLAVEDIDQHPLIDSKIKLGQPLFLKLKIKRLNGSTGKFTFLLAAHVEDTEGTVYSSESMIREINDESSWISIAGGIRRMLTYSSSKETYMSFKIKDRYSDAIIQGFIKFTVVQ